MGSAVETIHCNQCGRPSATDALFCQHCGGNLAPHIAPPRVQSIQSRYAGFWIRAVAALIDLTLMFMVLRLCMVMINSFITTAGLGANLSTAKILGLHRSIRLVLGISFGCLYRAGLESSEYQATLGKLVIGIKVTDLSYQRLSLAHAIKRYFAKFVSTLTLGIGYIMAGFDNQKRALHDRLAETFVLYR